ncbi:MAG: DEAD/DEAH box helicase [Deltaproteobacteria bacterium]|nr:DEAD/DEAH box helicase [Deltaproteobacteria bacterium]
MTATKKNHADFAKLGLIEPLLRALASLEHRVPTPIQVAAIPTVLAGRDLLAIAQTGTGKTAAFALPLLQRLVTVGPVVAPQCVRALVLVPTRELAEQVCAGFASYAKHLPLRVYATYGGASLGPQITALQRGVDVLVATPGRLLDLHRQTAVDFRQLQTLVLDEADRMLDLGFADELRAVGAALPKTRQTLLFSATMPGDVRDLAARLLRDPARAEVSPGRVAPAAVSQVVIPVDKKRKAELLGHLLTQRNWRQVLVFAKTRERVDALAAYLQQRGIAAQGLHGDKPQATRQQLLGAFKDGATRVLVATDVASRGLDIADLPAVIHFDLPLAAEDFVHRSGRTGRAGQSGESVALVSADEAPQLAALEQLWGRPLARIDEPGFEPVHRVPTAALTRPPSPPTAKPATGTAGSGAGRDQRRRG